MARGGGPLRGMPAQHCTRCARAMLSRRRLHSALRRLVSLPAPYAAGAAVYVEAGQKFGGMGSTYGRGGYATGVHLRFTLGPAV